ncbi:MAG: TIGR01777 family oxidoreductase [Thermoguttaceae bacterium]|nr:TIGR01777 family oxidoreductase [Thermoguttaceae bacterium]MDW8037625.1 TIGR01777 family oxidoreductase [Thermoguttaceae bacterium]
MRILISGSTGFLGKAIRAALKADGHELLPLLRRQPEEADEPFVLWDPAAGQLNPAQLEGLDAVIHLAGENIAARWWTAVQKQRIRSSRVDATRLLAETLAGLRQKPQSLLSASAIGFYGDRGDEILSEVSPPGRGFLAEVCQAWESATQPAQQAGIRVVHLRFGVVLWPSGGMLAKLLPVFRWALGGRLGSGRQWLSWVSLQDVIGAVRHLLSNPTLSGPFNITAPSPVTNAEWTVILSRVLRRPAIFHLPAWLLRLVLGEMADQLLLASTRAIPYRLQDSGFSFQDGILEPALQRMLREYNIPT